MKVFQFEQSVLHNNRRGNWRNLYQYRRDCSSLRWALLNRTRSRQTCAHARDDRDVVLESWYCFRAGNNNSLQPKRAAAV